MCDLTLIENIYRLFIGENPEANKIKPLIFSGENNTLAFIISPQKDDNAYVIKIAKPQSRFFFEREILLYEHLNVTPLKKFLNPPIVSCEYCGVKFSASHYIVCDISDSIRSSEKFDEQLFAFFELIHGMAPPSNLDENIFYKEIISFVFHTMKQKKIELPEETEKYCRAYLHHGDLSKQNTLYSSNHEIKIIDWEYASPGWPFNDIWHYYLSSVKICNPSEMHKARKIVLRLKKIIQLINQDQFSRTQLEFFNLCSLYSFFKKNRSDEEKIRLFVSNHMDSLFMHNNSMNK